MIYTEDEIKVGTRKLLSVMSISNMKETVSSIGAIILAFKDNLAIEDQQRLLLAQAIIADLDLSHRRNLVMSMIEKEKEGKDDTI